MDKPSDDFRESMLQSQQTILSAIEKLNQLMTEMRKEIHIQTIFANSKLDITSNELRDLLHKVNQRLEETDKKSQSN